MPTHYWRLFLTNPHAPYEKSKYFSYGGGGGIVARMKMTEMDGWVPLGVDPED